MRLPDGRRIAAACVLASVAGVTMSAQSAPRPCDGPTYRQFDFWIGDWDVFERGASTKAADVRIASVLDGCALQEDYTDPTGLHGTSISSYDAAAGQWQQTWVTNRGQLVVIHGVREGNALVFNGFRHDGPKQVMLRARWQPEGTNVRQTAEVSADGGATWQQWFDLDFRPRR